MHRSLSAEGSGTLRLTEMPTATGDTSKGEIWVYDRERDTRVPLPSGDPERMATPKQIGSYDIVRELGRGGMGVVYQAHSRTLERQVALKLLHVGASVEDLVRLRIEARALARAAHPNVITIHGVHEDAGRWYLVLDLVEGPSLGELLGKGPLESKEAARVTLGLANALAHIHARGLVHRDVKPSNVLMTPDGTPVLTDFGLARDTRRAGSGYTVTGAIMGTPAYMSPEQALSDWPHVDHQTDVYSLGATLYAMLAGRAPFTGALLTVLQSVIVDSPPAPSTWRASIDPDLEAICLTAMNKRPEDRYASAEEFAQALYAYLAGAPVSTRVVVVTRSADPKPTSAPRARRPRRRAIRMPRGVLAAGLGAVVAAALAVPLAGLLAPTESHGQATALSAAGDLQDAEDAARWSNGSNQRSNLGDTTEGDQASADGDASPDRQPPVRKGSGLRQEPGALAPPSADAPALELEFPHAPGANDTRSGDQGSLAAMGVDADSSPTGIGFAPGTGREVAARAEASDEDETDEDETDEDEPGEDDDGLDGGWILDTDEEKEEEEDGTRTRAETASNPVTQALLGFSSMQLPAPNYQPYAKLVNVERDAKGYLTAPYHRDAGSDRPGVLAAYGEATLVGHSTRVDWIVDGGVYSELQLAATVRSSAVSAGQAFVTTGDPAVAGSGDIYARGLDGSWAVSYDGAGASAVVATFGDTVYAATSGPPGTPALVLRYDRQLGVWEVMATLGQCVPTEMREFMGEVWIIATPTLSGDSIHLYSGSNRVWTKADRALGSKKLKDDERVRSTASLVVHGNLFVATVKQDADGDDEDGDDVESELLVYEADRQGKKRFKRFGSRLRGESLLSLAYQDQTVYAGTSKGRLLFLERKPEKKGKKGSKKFEATFKEDRSVGLNGGISSLLPVGGNALLVGLAGNAGSEVLLRAPQPNQ
jgi:hypothetical protein